MNLDGENRTILFRDSQYHPIASTVHNGFVYWVDNRNGTVRRLNIHHLNHSSVANINQTQIFLVDRGRTSNLKMYDINAQLNNTNRLASCDSESIQNCQQGLCFKTPEKQTICRCFDYVTKLSTNLTSSLSQTESTATTTSYILLNNFSFNCTIYNREEEPIQNCTNGFQCLKSQQCVEKKDICDGFHDCEDGSDEDNSTTNSPCHPLNCDKNLNFICNERCYQRSLMCSPMTYCADGTDQANCTHHTCNSFEFTCLKSGRCIQMSWVNDGVVDCGPDDSSDENDDIFYEKNCPEHMCENGDCILLSALCDGIDQCG